MIGKHQVIMFMALSKLMTKVWCIELPNANFQNLGRTQKVERSNGPNMSQNRLKVPLYHPKAKLVGAPLIRFNYITHLKGVPLMLSLSTNASLGSERLGKAHTQSITFCSTCTGKTS